MYKVRGRRYIVAELFARFSDMFISLSVVSFSAFS